MDALSRITRAPVILPSVERPHIYKDPPSARYTRKYEPVNMGDVNHYIRSDTDRISDSINYFPRGIDPMKSVEYNNTGGGRQASLPYKVMRHGAFRPPMYAIEDRLPLSRMKYSNYIARTNPCANGGLTPDDMTVNPLDMEKIIKQYKLQGVIEPNASYAHANASLVQDSEEGSHGRFLKDLPLKQLGTNFQIMITGGPNNDIEYIFNVPMRDRLYIAQQASKGLPIPLWFDNPIDGTSMKLKDYKWKVMQSSVSGYPSMLILEDKEKTLQKKMPYYQALTSIAANASVDVTPELVSFMQFDKPKITVTAQSSQTSNPYGDTTDQQRNVKLKPTIVIGNEFTNAGQIPSYAADCPEYRLERKKMALMGRPI